MVARLGAAVLFTSLSFATPSLAVMAVMESSYSLDLREGEAAVLQALEGAPVADTILAQLPTADLPAPLFELEQQATSDSATTADAVLAQLPQVEVPEGQFSLFADREDSENFSWMTAGSGDSEDLTTGSVLQVSDFPPVVVEHQFADAPFRIMSPLTDDALRALELAAP
jgi:hypothetical protein